MAEDYTAEQMLAILVEDYPDPAELGEVRAKVNAWLARGDGVAVYRNHDMSSIGLGEPRLASFGSPAALLETDTPPQRLPDTPTLINFRFWLEGTYRGGVLPPPADPPEYQHPEGVAGDVN